MCLRGKILTNTATWNRINISEKKNQNNNQYDAMFTFKDLP